LNKPEYICVGHITQDHSPSGTSLGGTAIYSSLTARALGKQPAIVTNCAPDLDCSAIPKDIPVIKNTSSKTTTFENQYTSLGRRQIIQSVADPITLEAIPREWLSTPIIHLGPVANEVDPEIIYHQKATIVGLTPQGWHRGWDLDGNVSFISWPRAKDILPEASAVIVSREDISDEETWQVYKKNCRILVVTYGSEGCLVRHRNKERHFSAPEYKEVDPTGVGDIFAAAFFIKLFETDGDPIEAARFATRVAAPSVTRRGLEGIPTHHEVKTLLRV